jgi:hypothetical protein
MVGVGAPSHDLYFEVQGGQVIVADENPSPAFALGKHTPTPLLLLWQHDELVRQLQMSKDGVSPYVPEVWLRECCSCKRITSVHASHILNIAH